MRVKLFEQYVESVNEAKKDDKVTKREYDEVTEPKKPMGRKLTDEESKVMHKNFKNHSWTMKVDANGHILLGGGEGNKAKFYITEKDLEKLVKDDKE